MPLNGTVSNFRARLYNKGDHLRVVVQIHMSRVYQTEKEWKKYAAMTKFDKIRQNPSR